MMRVPTPLEKHRKVAERYLAEGRIRDIEFSRRTYQVQVADKDTNKKYWAFLQLGPNGQLADRFCSCDLDEGSGACEHIAAAYLSIYGERHQPLHRRFLDSLWVHLTRLAFEELGDDPKKLKKKGEGHYQAGKRFSIQAKGKQGEVRLQEMLKEPDVNEEETSLKVSSLTSEEIEAWMEGEAPPQLRYELSHWCEFAKWIMILEEFGSDPKISFEGKGLPTGLKVQVKGVTLTVGVDKEEWPQLLPSLVDRDLSLEVRHLQEEAIKRIQYDAEKRLLKVETGEERSVEGVEEGVKLDGWYFLEGKGFYCRTEHPLLGQKEIGEEQIPFALSEFGALIQRHLDGVEIHSRPQSLTPHLEFDQEGNLTLSSYLFQPGDLAQPGSALFDEWVYLPNDGFYRVDPEGEHYHREVIPRSEVADYVTLNRGWFNSQPGFQTHLAQVEVYLTYEMDEQEQLSFVTRLETGEGGEIRFDFGRWLYIEGQGFFTKRSATLGSFLSAGATVEKKDIPKFVREHHDELLHVREFFCPENPILRVTLKLVLQRDNTIVVTPQYTPTPRYRDKKFKVMGDVVYVEGEGFAPLPAGQVLPPNYRAQKQIKQKELSHFLSDDLPKLEPFLGEVDPRLQRAHELAVRVVGAGEESRNQVGIPLAIELRSSIGISSLLPVLQAAHAKQRFVFSDAGLLDLQDPQLEWIHRIEREAVKGEFALLSTLEILRLDALVGLEIGDEVKSRKLDLLLGRKKVDKPKITALRSTLRPYQELGVQWLWYLYRNSLSGLLCDDMGLGKTHQAMALIAAIRAKRTRAKILVVCPTSVIYHWQDKLELFLPEICVRTYYGPRRSLEPGRKPFDLILTSYGVVRRDYEQLSAQKLEIAILDEIQVAKNHTSRVHQALCKLKTNMFVGLTGTPMENRLRELKSLFDIILPGYMPGETHYRNFFVAPIEKLHDRKRQELLAQFVKPFLLRRRKQEVLDDLPDKQEDIAHCGLSDDQVRLYEEVLSRNGRALVSDLEDEEKSVSYVHIFALLTLLKQICNHPAIYEKNLERYKEYESGKFDLFCELLSEARDSKQKVVVFTQFLGMMDIIEAYLKENEIGYASIRGSTRDRRKEMERFQNDEECEVFVGSLQASGVGIDLTAASVVIHYDRWWNPAREDQATDRVHRIGQTRGVQVFKLVSKDTLEEQIDRIIERKRDLLAKVVTSDEENVLKQFDRQELISLLKSVHQ